MAAPFWASENRSPTLSLLMNIDYNVTQFESDHAQFFDEHIYANCILHCMHDLVQLILKNNRKMSSVRW